jgi:hypothetical protein
MRLLGFGRLLPDAAWSQWQPTLTAHDPDPPLPLESVPVVTPAVGGVLDLFRLHRLFLRFKGGEVVVAAVAPVGEASYLLPLGGRKAPPGWQLRGTALDAAPVVDPIFPPMSRVPRRSSTAPPDAYFWVEPAVAVVAPFLGQATQVPHGRPPVPPQMTGEAPIVLQGELPLPPTAPPVIPRRAPSTPLETYQWPGLSALDPHIEDFPVAPWTATTGVPKAGTWRPVGVLESQVPPVAVVEPPPGQSYAGRGASRAPEGGTWATFWNPPDVAAPLPPGTAEGGVPPARLPVRGLVELSVRAAQTLLGELPPGRTAQSGGRSGGRGPVAWDLPSTLLFAVVLPPPPAPSGTGGAPRSALRRGRTTIWSWSGYIPAPATPMPPGVQKGPFAGKGHGHAPVSPYHAAYVISLPPALFGPAELWQFPDGTTLYTFGGDGPVAWAFQADRIIWEW